MLQSVIIYEIESEMVLAIPFVFAEDFEGGSHVCLNYNRRYLT